MPNNTVFLNPEDMLPQGDHPVADATLHVLGTHIRNLDVLLDLVPLAEERNRKVLEIMIEKPEIFDLLRQFAVSRIRTSEQLLIALKKLAINEVRTSADNTPKETVPTCLL